jgi:hypothetical protein
MEDISGRTDLSCNGLNIPNGHHHLVSKPLRLVIHAVLPQRFRHLELIALNSVGFDKVK